MTTIFHRNHLQWDYCPVAAQHRHTQYRGFDVHQWYGYLCFYPTEGEATQDEMATLRERIRNAGLATDLCEGRRDRDIPYHCWNDLNGSCELKPRLDQEKYNYCLETPSFTALDRIIDGLWEASGLNKDFRPPEHGRVR